MSGAARKLVRQACQPLVHGEFQGLHHGKLSSPLLIHLKITSYPSMTLIARILTHTIFDHKGNAVGSPLQGRTWLAD